MMAEQTSILLTYVNIERLNKYLSPAQCWEIVMMMKDFNQGVDIDVDKLEPLMGMGFDIVKEELIENKKRFEKKCNQNSTNGKKGGRGRKKKAVVSDTDKLPDNDDIEENEKAVGLSAKSNQSGELSQDEKTNKAKKAAVLIARKKGKKPG